MTEVNLTSRITLPKRAMTLGVATETRTVKGFYPKHWYGDAHHNDAPRGTRYPHASSLLALEH
jgi:hypothetical protein